VSATETIAPLAPTGTWEADRSHSAVSFEIEHSGISTFRGGFGDYDASLSGGERPSLEGSARVASAVVQDENLAGHLQSPDFFDAEQHPQITFSASGLTVDGERLTVRGELAIKGVTRELEATGTIAGPAIGIDGQERVGISLETVINRHDFGVSWNAALPGGGNVLADDVTLSVDLELVRS
jgi:polyisoprenoid-binding protein YceI